jgi:1-acyl-sn-glycerol-3-phosphate acyltransferase
LRITVKGAENIPKGGCIIASNHISFLDPFLLARLPLKVILGLGGIRFLTAAHYYDKSYMRIIIKPLGAIRSHPLPWSFEMYFKEASDVLRTGGSVLIYPEGRRTQKLGAKAKPGIAYLAHESALPVIPIRVRKTAPRCYSLTFGDALTVKNENYQVEAGNIMATIEKL